ncbi:hypothetical protein GW17_00059975 [Ensete ventricosum]|nr:hypothetical protein GW17_00059975 [Ensete ventricosum]
MYLPMVTRMGTVSRKNVTVIIFTQSRTQSYVLIDFLCTVLEFQNTSHSQYILSPNN